MACNYSDLIGIPFRFGGRSRDGIDCWGLVIEVYRRLGIEVEDIDDYGALTPEVVAPELEAAVAPAWRQVVEPFEPYDVLTFDTLDGGAVTHCAVWVGAGRMLHAIEKLGVILTPLSYMRGRFLGAYRRAEVTCPA